MKTSQLINEFLQTKNIAVAGVSRNPQGGVGNFIYKKFKQSGYNVFQINPNAGTIEGDICYCDLKSIPQKIDSVFIATNPEQSLAVVTQCIENGVSKIWFHRAFGNGSYSKEAEDFCRQNNIIPITYGCPVMHLQPVDFGHKCIKFFMKLSGKI
ncbi:MAG: CoA-binding protein [Ignavibacteriales bacterium]|nr:CoA-binding protein [Ignavibacteriales bacterium]